MNILAALDSFKGSLTSEQAGKAVAEGIHRAWPQAKVTVVPVADGGEGTVAAIVKTAQGKVMPVVVTSPIGEKVRADLGLLPDGTAVVEVAQASGLNLVPMDKRNPLLTTSYGTGELIRAALDLGVGKILIGLGGSATNDGGAGMAQALGVRFLDDTGEALPWGGGGLARLHKLDTSGIDPRLDDVEIIVMCDVTNPLTGPQGSSAVYGPQKGATLEMVAELDNALVHYAQVIRAQMGIDIELLPGAGAAGGLGGGLVAFAGGTLKPGIEMVLEAIGFASLAQQTDLVITGEGRIDGQSLYGKVPMGVALRAKEHGKPVVAIAGSIGPGAERLYEHGVEAIMPIIMEPMTLAEAMASAYALAADAAERAARWLDAGLALQRGK